MPTIREFPTLRGEIAGLSIPQLVAEFGTPTYFYDAAPIAERISDLQAFDAIRYAQKASSNLAILDFVRRRGVLVDAVSAGEILRAIAAGYPTTGEPAPIVYTADLFDRAALDLVVEHNIAVNVGSPDMIDQLGERAPGRAITLRINPGFGHGHSRKTNTGGDQSKHGIWHDQLADCQQRAARWQMTIDGLHMHIGSGTDLEHLSQVGAAMEQAAAVIGPSVRTISAGGGLPIPYTPEQNFVDLDAYFEIWDGSRKRLEEKFGHPISLEIEPGRYLAAESGYLVAEVRAIKQMGGNTFYLVDAGFNDLARPILYGAHHPISICPKDGTIDERPLRDVVVGGPLCESGDIFTQEEGGYVCTRSLPQAEVGDFLVLECAGAYGFVMASNYNSRPLAAEVLIRAGQADLIRRRQTLPSLFADEIIPPAESSR